MSDHAGGTVRWPRFELVTYHEPTGIPHGWDDELVKKGVPKSLFGRYQAANTLTLVEDARYGRLVRFGTTMRTDSICLEPHTGAVLWLINGPNGPVWLVNSSLDQFSASVRAVIERAPFERMRTREEHEQDEFAANWDQAVEDLSQCLRHLDPDAMKPEIGFWQTFLDDVQMGDFSIEAIVGSDP